MAITYTIQSVVHCGKFSMKQNVDVSCSEFRRTYLHMVCIFSIWTPKKCMTFNDTFPWLNRSWNFQEKIQDFPGLSRRRGNPVDSSQCLSYEPTNRHNVNVMRRTSSACMKTSWSRELVVQQGGRWGQTRSWWWAKSCAQHHSSSHTEHTALATDISNNQVLSALQQSLCAIQTRQCPIQLQTLWESIVDMAVLSSASYVFLNWQTDQISRTKLPLYQHYP